MVVDGQGRKMSKSLGNGMEPHEIYNKLGAEIIRLWVASTDYSGELALSDEILKRVVESYRRIRNTLRFLLANVADFDFDKQAVAPADMLEIDRYALAYSANLQNEIEADFARYEFHPVVSKVQTYCSEFLGAFYLDILKDRLYTCAANSVERRFCTDRVASDHRRVASNPRTDGLVHRRGSLGDFPAEALARARRDHLYADLVCVAIVARMQLR